jgi:hypothetical protein
MLEGGKAKSGSEALDEAFNSKDRVLPFNRKIATK